MALITYAIIAGVLIGVDQLSKFLIVANLKVGESIPVWSGVFEIKRAPNNKGIAWSLFEDLPPWVFVVLSVVILTAIVVAVIKIKLPKPTWVRVAASMIVAGGLGNVIDRVMYGAVVDFLYVKLIDFPIFNFADCCVCVGAFILIFYVIFIYREPAIEKGADK